MYSKETTENWREDQNSPPLLIFSSSFFIKIDFCGIKFAMIIQHPHGVGNIIAWGHNLCVQL
jgi:hypothetical protein